MMSKLKAFIIDDEKGSIISLKSELQDFDDQIEIVGDSQNPVTALEILKTIKIDVLFLDIEMPQINGFEFLKRLGKFDFDVIFTTAYDEFALQAFEVSALDYLLKPVDSDDLSRALKKIKTQPNHTERFDILFEILQHKTNDFDRIAIPTLEGLEFIKINNIIRCESDSNYCILFRKDGSKVVISKPLKLMENKLTLKGFFRVHNSHLVNVRFIQKYRKGKNGSLLLLDGTIIPISRNKKEGFLKVFNRI